MNIQKNKNCCTEEKYPNIIFASDEIESKISNWYISGVSLDKCLGLIFFKLGFENKDNIVLSNYSHQIDRENHKHSFELDCAINGWTMHKFIFENNDLNNFESTVIFTHNNVKKIIQFVLIIDSVREILDFITNSMKYYLMKMLNMIDIIFYRKQFLK